MPLRFERVVGSDAVLAFHGIEEAATSLDHPGLPAETVEDLFGMLPDGTPSERVELGLAYDGGELVANTFVMFPLLDNTNTANANVTVAPSARRRGVGREAATHVLDRIRAEGREVVVTFIGAPLGSTAPGDGLARSLGAAPALESIRRALGVQDLDDRALDAIVERGVGDHAADYDVVQWVDSAPDELVERAASILPLVFSDSPRGDLAYEPEVWDTKRFREYEASVARRGRRLLVTGAIERRSGRLVAYTELTVPTSRHEVAGQWGTIVEREHRGHRLGLLVKAENLRHLRRAFPDVEAVTTWNATENRHMISVNEELGFRPVERYYAWQLTL